jgi:hypothetical protein
MKHVFVESNWVFACCAPRHLRNPTAERLLQQARDGALVLHLPAICLREAGDAIRKKCQPRIPEEMKDFVKGARNSGILSPPDADAFFKVVDLYYTTVAAELRALDRTLEEVQNSPGVDAFALSDEMLERAIQLRTDGPSGLKPFDESILASVLVRAHHLRASGVDDMAFCVLDGHMQPWTKEESPRPKPPLNSLYDEAGLWVYGDFLMERPERPADWKTLSGRPKP